MMDFDESMDEVIIKIRDNDYEGRVFLLDSLHLYDKII